MTTESTFESIEVEDIRTIELAEREPLLLANNQRALALPKPTEISKLSRDEQFHLLEQQVGHTAFDMLNHSYLPTLIYMKCEYENPSGSHYDRVYLPTIKALETEGLINPGDELRDITSGSAGISLAFMGAFLGYPVRITVPDELPQARIAPMIDLNAEVVRCGTGYIKRTSEFQRTEIKSLIEDGWKRIRSADPEMRAVILEKDGNRVCYINHSENQLSPDSFRSIGEEIIAFCVRIRRTPEAVVLAMGNWTTIAGIAPVISEHYPETDIVGYEGENRDIHDNFGTSVDGVPLRFRDDSLLDSSEVVTNNERDAMDPAVNIRVVPQRKIGHSSLMGLVVAERIANKKESMGRIITIAYDQKSRY